MEHWKDHWNNRTVEQLYFWFFQLNLQITFRVLSHWTKTYTNEALTGGYKTF